MEMEKKIIKWMTKKCKSRQYVNVPKKEKAKTKNKIKT